jgi:putative flippase GtrA
MQAGILTHSFVRFGFLSGGGWLLDCLLLLIIAAGFDASPQLANFLSSSIAALTVFTVSRYLVFAPASEGYMLKTLVYAIYTLLVILSASALIGAAHSLSYTLTEALGIRLSQPEHLFIAKIFITPPQLLANYLMSRYLIERLGR